MLSHDLQLNLGCNFTYATKAILVVNDGCNCFIVANWHFISSDCSNNVLPHENNFTWAFPSLKLLLFSFKS
jgi:hypothetical protein